MAVKVRWAFGTAWIVPRGMRDDARRWTRKRMRRWAHQFGFGGHCFTKSRRFSTTFKALRETRATYAADRVAISPDQPAKSDRNLIHVSTWSYVGSGYRKSGNALMAASSHARAREQRRLARDAAMDQASRGHNQQGEAG